MRGQPLQLWRSLIFPRCGDHWFEWFWFVCQRGEVVIITEVIIFKQQRWWSVRREQSRGKKWSDEADSGFSFKRTDQTVPRHVYKGQHSNHLWNKGPSKPANYQDCYCLYLLTKSSGITRQKNVLKQQLDATAFLWMQWLQRQILWIFWNPVSRGCRWPEAGWPLGPGWLLHRLFPRDQL